VTLRGERCEALSIQFEKGAVYIFLEKKKRYKQTFLFVVKVERWFNSSALTLKLFCLTTAKLVYKAHELENCKTKHSVLQLSEN